GAARTAHRPQTPRHTRAISTHGTGLLWYTLTCERAVYCALCTPHQVPLVVDVKTAEPQPMAEPAREPAAPAQPVKPQNIVKLNVGGSRYTVGISTLTCAESSYFDILFSGRWSSQLTEEGEVFIDRDGEVFKHVLHYLRARASSSEALYLPADEPTRQALIAEARYYMLPGLEALLEAPSGAGSFGSVYKQQTTALDEYIEAQPFAAIKQLVFDILLGQRQLKSAWNPSLDQGTIMVSLMNAPLIRMSFSVTIHSDHVALTENVNRFKVVLPDQLLESVFSGYYEIYLYEFAARSEVSDVNRCIYNLGTRAVLLRMLQEQMLFDVRMAYDKRPRSNGAADFELVLEFHRRAAPASPRYSAP
ncbi:MAG: hypothetical protein J3K34DRAFT_231311, partial [Monoraphidium minutum]